MLSGLYQFRENLVIWSLISTLVTVIELNGEDAWLCNTWPVSTIPALLIFCEHFLGWQLREPCWLLVFLCGDLKVAEHKSEVVVCWLSHTRLLSAKGNL